MKQDADFYKLRIAEADRDIGAAILSNVRERATRARARWVELAAQEAKAVIERDKHRREKVERDTARDLAAAASESIAL